MRAVNFPGMKGINRSIVLNLVRSGGPISRGEIARRSGLAPSAVSNIVGELLELGLVREAAVGPSSGGRPAALLELNAGWSHVIGVNVGLTRITTVAIDLLGRPVERDERPTHAEEGPDAVLGRVVQAVRDVSSRLKPSPAGAAGVAGVSVGIPGLVETATGRSLFSPNMNWRNVPVREILEERLGTVVHVDNDVRAATLGEREYGAGEKARTMVAVFVGSAVGSGLILDGKLYYGASDGAGELGHVRVSEEGPLCSCGKYGCLEAVASGRAIAAKAARVVKAGLAPTRLADLDKRPEEITAEDVARLAGEGDAVAAQIMGEAARYVGLAVSFLVNVYNPERVVVSGGVSQAGELFLGPIREMVERHAMPVARDRVVIVRGKLGRDAGPIGAAALVLGKLFPSIQLAQSDLLA